jgi:hypothetical protein
MNYRDGEEALREVMLKQPAKFCALIAALQPQHFKFEHEHAVVALSGRGAAAAC